MRTMLVSRFFIMLLGMVFLATQHGLAQDYPTKPIRLVVPFAPGGGTDLIARTMAQQLTEAWGQRVVVDHRPGGTGAVGSVTVAKAPPDGYTLLIVTSSTHAIGPSVQRDVPYDPVKDFAPVALIASAPEILAAHPSVPANSITELVALAKAKPGGLNYASPGTGTIGHMTFELFKSITGADVVHVPYKGSGAAVTELLGGQVQLMFSAPGAVIVQARAKRLKILGVATPKRPAGFEDVPTFAEAGYPAIDASNWYGMLATAGTPRSVVDKLNREIVRATQMPDVKKRFFARGYYVEQSTPQEFAQLIKNENAKWQKVAKASGIVE